MLKLNRKTEYGLMAIKYLQGLEPGHPASARDIAESSGAPFDLLSKVLQRLHSLGIVQSTQGIRGGYALDRNLEEINFAQFIEAIEGPIALTSCLSEKGSASCDMAGTCNILPPMAHLNTKLNEVLSQMTLAEVTQL